MGLLSALPGFSAGNCCCLWQLLGGGLAGWILCRSASQPVSSGEGTIVGLFSGLLGAMLFSLINAITFSFKPDHWKFSFEQAFQVRGAEIPPELETALEQIINYATHPSLLLITLLFFSLLLFAIIAMLGSVLSVIIFEPRFRSRRKKEALEFQEKIPEPVRVANPVEPTPDLWFPRKNKEEK